METPDRQGNPETGIAKSDVSAASIAKMGRGENVTTDVLLRICEALDCNVEDIMERVPNIAKEKKEKNTES